MVADHHGRGHGSAALHPRPEHAVALRLAFLEREVARASRRDRRRGCPAPRARGSEVETVGVGHRRAGERCVDAAKPPPFPAVVDGVGDDPPLPRRHDLLRAVIPPDERRAPRRALRPVGRPDVAARRGVEAEELPLVLVVSLDEEPAATVHGMEHRRGPGAELVLDRLRSEIPPPPLVAVVVEGDEDSCRSEVGVDAGIVPAGGLGRERVGGVLAELRLHVGDRTRPRDPTVGNVEPDHTKLDRLARRRAHPPGRERHHAPHHAARPTAALAHCGRDVEPAADDDRLRPAAAWNRRPPGEIAVGSPVERHVGRARPADRRPAAKLRPVVGRKRPGRDDEGHEKEPDPP